MPKASMGTIQGEQSLRNKMLQPPSNKFSVQRYPPVFLSLDGGDDYIFVANGFDGFP
jgi:hypothetical protein